MDDVELANTRFDRELLSLIDSLIMVESEDKMPKDRGTANLLAQDRAYRELSNDYNPDVANCLTSKSLLRHGIEASDGEVAAWARLNQACYKGRLDIRHEVARAESKAATAAGTAVTQVRSGDRTERHR